MFSKVWLLSTGERVVKTFFQGFVTFWFLAAGLGGTPTEVPSSSALDLLFTMDNVKAGVVAAVLSLVTSIGSTPLGVDKNSPSVTVTETPPTTP